MDEVTHALTKGEGVGLAPSLAFDASSMVSSIVKSYSGSSQLADTSTSSGLDHGDLVIEPPIDPGDLWSLMELNPVHSACIGAKATDSFGRGWGFWREEEKEQQLTDRAREFFRTIVCRGWTFARLWRNAGTEMDAIGYGLVEVTRDDQNVINGLFPLPAQTFRVAKIATDEAGKVSQVGGEYGKVWVQKREERTRYFVRFAPNRENVPNISRQTGAALGEDAEPGERATEVLPVIFPTPRSTYYGLGDWISGSGAIAELAAIRSYNEAFFSSNGMLDSIIHVKSDQGVEAATAVRQEIEKQFREAKGRQHVNVFVSSDQGVEIDVMPMSQKQRFGDADSGFSDGKIDNVKELLVAHQVPPYRVGWAEVGSLGGNTAKEMLEAYRFGVVEPRQELVQGAVSELLEDQTFAPLGLAGFEFKFEDVDWDAFERDLQTANDGVEQGALNRDEWRKMLGFEETGLPEMQEFLVNGQRIGPDAESMMQTFQDELRTLSGMTGEESVDEPEDEEMPEVDA